MNWDGDGWKPPHHRYAEAEPLNVTVGVTIEGHNRSFQNRAFVTLDPVNQSPATITFVVGELAKRAVSDILEL